MCRNNEIDEVLDFIGTYWKENHVLTRDITLMNWQHYDSTNDQWNFVVARCQENKEIHAILGFLSTKHFDPTNESNCISPCIWRKRDDIEEKGLGMACYYYLAQCIDFSAILSPGASEMAMYIYRKLGANTGLMDHFYFSNPYMKESISRGRIIQATPYSHDNRYTIKELSVEDFERHTLKRYDLFTNEYKGKEYYVNRYYKHPRYKYIVWGMFCDGYIVSVMIVRACFADNSKALRIVDYFGEWDILSKMSECIVEKLVLYRCEYIDFLEHGFPTDILKKTGFLNRRDSTRTIIPHHFEPYEKENIDVNYAFLTDQDRIDIVVYKGDGDLDRPNQCLKDCT